MLDQLRGPKRKIPAHTGIDPGDQDAVQQIKRQGLWYLRDELNVAALAKDRVVGCQHYGGRRILSRRQIPKSSERATSVMPLRNGGGSVPGPLALESAVKSAEASRRSG